MSQVHIFPESQVKFLAQTHQTTYFARLVELIDRSKESIRVCQYVFSISQTRSWQRSNKVFEAFKRANSRGVEIAFLFDRPRQRSPNFKTNLKTAWELMSAGIQVRCLSINKTLHIKLLIFDRSIFLAGSHNITNSSLYSPFELTFECQDQFLCNSSVIYFEALWNSSLSEPFPKTEQELKRFIH